MIGVILWKEYREHRLVWAALACMGVLFFVGLPVVQAALAPEDWSSLRESLCGTAVLLSWLYGMICGVLLLAGEREAGTLAFLDALPGLRRRIWLAKFLAGVILVLAQIAFLMGVAAAAQIFTGWEEAGWTLTAMSYFGLFGFAWGLLFSSFGRSVMNLILACFFGQLLANLLGVFLANILYWITMATFGVARPADPWTFLAPIMGGVSFLTAPAALVGSALVFTRLDRRRLGAPEEPARAQPRKPRVSWSVLFWLTWRQAAGFAAGLALFALFLGFFTLLQGVVLWPMVTGLVGVLCGVTAFADEQEGPFRFLGDQRLPLGRLWLVKVGVRFAIAVVASLIVLAPSLVLALANAPDLSYGAHQEYSLAASLFNSTLLVTLCPPSLFLTMWLAYGFAAGCLCGLLFRNGLAAGVFALFTTALLTAAWVPSLLHGGLHAWQVFGPPLLLLLATWLILRPWAAGRVASWTTAARLTPVVVLVVLWIAGGLWYRVLEVPVAPAKYDLNAFAAGLPKGEENKGGELMRGACSQFNALSRQLASETPPPAAMGAPAVPGAPAAPMAGPGAAPLSQSLQQRADDTLEHGWPAADPELAAWLDKLFAGDWVQMLHEAADLPPGMVEDLRNETIMSPDPLLEPARRIAMVLVARGLQRQAAGDDEAYVENLRVGLALSRALRTHANDLESTVGRVVESALVHGLDRWLEKLKGRPDLLHKALGLLATYLDDTRNAGSGVEQILVDYLIARNSVGDPYAWIVEYLNDYGRMDRRENTHVRTEALWVAVSGQLVPWEQERQDRLLRLMFEGTDAERAELYHNPHSILEKSPLAMLNSLSVHLRPQYGSPPCWEQAMQLKLALRWYQADNGRPADNLDQLVPKYLPAIPPDPIDGRPFRYRLSRGEEIDWPEEPPAQGGAAGGMAPGNPPGMPGAPPAGSMPGGVVPINPPFMPGADAGAVPAAPPPPPATRKVPAGQGILWSVGQDGVDDGGHRQENPAAGSTRGADLIFLVPLPPKDK